MNPRKERNKRSYRCREIRLPFRYGKARQEHLATLLRGESLVGAIKFADGFVIIKVRKTDKDRKTRKVDQLINDAIHTAATFAVTAQIQAT